MDPQIYLLEEEGYRQVHPDSSFSSLGLGSSASSSSLMSSMMSTDVFYQLPENEDLYKSQYEVMAGRWPEEDTECVLVLSSSGGISDFMLYSLGLRDSLELSEMIQQFLYGENVEAPEDLGSYSYEDILGITFKLVSSADYYEYDSTYDIWTDKTDNETYMTELVENGEDMEIVGIVQPAEDASVSILSSGIYYQSSLITHIAEVAAESEIVQSQLDNPDVNVFTNVAFGEEEESEFDLSSIFSFDTEALQSLFELDEDTLADSLSGLDLSDYDFSSILDADSFSTDLSSLDLGSLDIDWSSVDWSSVSTDSLDFSNIDLASLDLDLSALDLSALDLSDLDLSTIDLSDMDLSALDLSDMDLSTIDLSDFDLSTLDLSSLDLSDIDLDFGSLLSSLDFSDLDIDWSSIDLSALDIDWSSIDWDSMEIDYEALLEEMPQVDIGALLEEMPQVDISMSADQLTALAQSLLEGYLEYAGIGDVSDYGNMSEYLQEYLTSEEAQNILTENIQQMIQANGDITVSTEQLQALIVSVMEDYQMYADENGYTDGTLFYEYLAEYLQTERAQEILSAWADENLQYGNAVSVTAEQLEQLTSDLVEGYQTYAEANGLADPFALSGSLSEYLNNEEAQQIIADGLAEMLDSDSISEQAQSYLQEYMENYLTECMEVLTEAVEEQIGEALTEALQEQIGEVLAEALQEQVGEALTQALQEQIGTMLSEAIGDQLNLALSEMLESRLSTALSETLMNQLSTALSESLQDQLSETLQNQISTALFDSLQDQLLTSLTDQLTSQFSTALSGMMEEQISTITSQILSQVMTSVMSQLTAQIETQLGTALTSVMEEVMTEMMQQLETELSDLFSIDADSLADAFQLNVDVEELEELLASMNYTTSPTYSSNLQSLGYVDFDEPYEIAIYPTDFENKEHVVEILDDYNSRMEASGQDEKVITYTDMVGTLMSSVTDIINTISYVLIAFVAISLVVSSIMIGVITYISVLERKKEIGILRAIGASKNNISQVFNAETFIIGLCAGLLGIGISLLLLIPGNMLIHYLAGTTDVSAILPVVPAIFLIFLSVILTIIGGLIPSRKAAKSDPVTALRTE